MSPNQSTFIKGHLIQDNFCCVLGTTKALASKKHPRVMFKIDLAKAFDSVGWVFLLVLLSTDGCLRTSINWVATILCTASTKVLLNGMSGNMICHGRSLRGPSLLYSW
jgi:hypothetical protein